MTLRDGTVFDVWTAVTAMQDGAVSFELHYAFGGAEELVSSATLRFRSEQDVRRGLSEAGFDVERVYGGMEPEPAGCGDGELLALARAARTP